MNDLRWIPLTGQYLSGKEGEYLLDVVENDVFSRRGRYSRRCEELLRKVVSSERVFLTPSGSASISMVGKCLDLGPGDEVIVPSFGFATCASTLASSGARIVFADSRADTQNIDDAKVSGLIGERTRALLVIHYAGVMCEMQALLDVASAHNIPVVEDSAHALFATYGGNPAGSMGALSILSFDHQKNLSCGQGGALVVNDFALLSKAEITYEFGTDRAAFERGEVDKYRWVGSGGNYAMSELQAAFLQAQLEIGIKITTIRKKLWVRYIAELLNWADENSVQLPQCPPECEPAAHLFYIIPPTADMRERISRKLTSCRIAHGSHYYPLHLSPEGRRMGGEVGQCPTTERLAPLLIRLPLHASLTVTEVGAICRAIMSVKA